MRSPAARATVGADLRRVVRCPRASARQEPRGPARRQRLMARLVATRRTHASGESQALTDDQRCQARANASLGDVTSVVQVAGQRRHAGRSGPRYRHRTRQSSIPARSSPCASSHSRASSAARQARQHWLAVATDMLMTPGRERRLQQDTLFSHECSAQGGASRSPRPASARQSPQADHSRPGLVIWPLLPELRRGANWASGRPRPWSGTTSRPGTSRSLNRSPWRALTPWSAACGAGR